MGRYQKPRVKKVFSRTLKRSVVDWNTETRNQARVREKELERIARTLSNQFTDTISAHRFLLTRKHQIIELATRRNYTPASKQEFGKITDKIIYHATGQEIGRAPNALPVDGQPDIFQVRDMLAWFSHDLNTHLEAKKNQKT